jgi:hypothetical protein
MMCFILYIHVNSFFYASLHLRGRVRCCRRATINSTVQTHLS